MKFGKALRGATPSAEILGLPLGLYFAVLALVLTGAFTGSLPPNMVGALALLMVVGEGCNKLGNTIPIVKTYLGGSVVCIFGGALLTLSGLLPAPTMQTLDVFVNQNGFLILYIAALITGSLLSIDKDLLLRASVRLLPVAVLSLAVGGLVCGALGVLFGNGFWDNILYVAVPMTSGGMTAGTVPLSTIYAAELGVSAADVLTRMAPATVLGNCIAIILAGLLNNAGKKHPAWSGNGQLVNDNQPVKKIVEGTPTPMSLCTGLVVSLAFYLLGALLHGLLPVIPTYAWMILA
ncbi:MAG: 2-hydroxycarboxylate transporter family protein, partial [Pygmaiobacter sp.]